MIRFAGHVIEVKKLFPKVENKRFVKKAMGPVLPVLLAGLGKAADMLASKLHDKWASGYRAGEMAKGNENPTRMKDDGMGGQVDILNTPFDQLPPKWQAENKAQAESAIKLVAQNMDRAMDNIDELAAQVHAQWLSRNEWAKDGPLGVPYSELPEEEKRKDIDVVKAAYEVLSQMMNQEGEEAEIDMPEIDESEEDTNI